ncbi:hypothetical protein Ari01nite_92970 [Paractinoplanes rishiriensis]|uniref:Uncharacterized protein n=1 Tax=Paractinoplanes rishiriensis TaxID=1050105 RepID=A0A919KAM2_9ACTN|nr:hypothetical protein Ari01nite_92970 [Actinoplanes rishiriensis]
MPVRSASTSTVAANLRPTDMITANATTSAITLGSNGHGGPPIMRNAWLAGPGRSGNRFARGSTAIHARPLPGRASIHPPQRGAPEKDGLGPGRVRPLLSSLDSASCRLRGLSPRTGLWSGPYGGCWGIRCDALGWYWSCHPGCGPPLS